MEIIRTQIDTSSADVVQGDAFFHGTPVGPDDMGERIQPRMPTRSPDGTAVVNHSHTDVICWSKQLAFPALRALLHLNHPVTQDANSFALARKVNRLGRAQLFIAADVLYSWYMLMRLDLSMAVVILPALSPIPNVPTLMNGAMRRQAVGIGWPERQLRTFRPTHWLLTLQKKMPERFLSVFKQVKLRPIW